MPAAGTYSLEAVRVLDTHRTPIQKQPEMLLCLVRISRRYYLGDEVYPTFLHDDDRDMDLFNLIRALNPTKVKIGSRPRAPHEVPLLTLTAPRVIEMDEPAMTDSSGVPSTIERSPLDFVHEAGASDQGAAAPEMPSSEDGHDRTDVNAPPKSLWRDHADPRPSRSSHGGKSLAAIQLGLASTIVVPEDAPMDVSDPDPLSFADVSSRHPVDAAQSSPGIAAVGDLESENASSPAEVRSPGSVYQPEWGVTNGSLLETPEACQDLVDHIAPPDLQVSNERLSQQVSTLQQQVSGEEKLKAAFKEFKRQQDERVEQRCAEMDARLDALSIDFDEELYPHMLTAIAGRRWVIGRIAKGLSEGLRHGLEHGLKGLEVSIGGSTGRSEGRTDGCDHGCPVRDPRNPWACKEEIGLADAIAANISRAEKKKRSRIVCRTHGVGSAHHA
nr:hypothetical protein [Tanacetum cinerariifolium]